MHDSWLTAVERLGHELRLTLNSIDADDFAREVHRLLGQEHASGEFPVDLVCHGVEYVSAVKEIKGGGLKWVDWEKFTSGEFLYDWFFEQDSHVQWIAQLWVPNRDTNKRPDNAYLLVDCASVSAVDRRRPAIVRTFGERYGNCWDGLMEISRQRNAFDTNFLRDYVTAYVQDDSL